jgi:hypothetical protein
LGEGASPGTGARLGEAIGRDQPGRLEEIGHELGDRVRLDARPWMGLGLDRRRLLFVGSDAPQELLKVFGRFHLNDLSA